VLSLISGQLATLIFSIPVLAAIVIYGKKMPGIEWLYGIPILVIIQFMIMAGVCMAIAIINAFFRDLEYIAGVCINMLFWVTPIIYPLSAIPERFRIILSLNPMMYVIQSWRDLIMTNTINWQHLGISFVSAFVFLAAGWWIFNKLSVKLDEVV
jgi:lipopolysaccharide transport system permease protein